MQLPGLKFPPALYRSPPLLLAPARPPDAASPLYAALRRRPGGYLIARDTLAEGKRGREGLV